MDDSDSSRETIFWVSQKGTLDIIDRARAELADGKGLDEAQIRAEFGVSNALE